jgi:hypothetical protein
MTINKSNTTKQEEIVVRVLRNEASIGWQDVVFEDVGNIGTMPQSLTFDYTWSADQIVTVIKACLRKPLFKSNDKSLSVTLVDKKGRTTTKTYYHE